MRPERSNYMTVKSVKKILKSALEALNDCADDLEIRCESNTYFVNKANAFLGTRRGYLPLDYNMLSDVLADAEEEASEDYDDYEESNRRSRVKRFR